VNRLAAEFYTDVLAGPEAVAGRTFLAERGFDRDAASSSASGSHRAG